MATSYLFIFICSSDDASASVDAALSANIRNLHSLIGLKCSPTFLHMTNDDTSQLLFDGDSTGPVNKLYKIQFIAKY